MSAFAIREVTAGEDEGGGDEADGETKISWDRAEKAARAGAGRRHDSAGSGTSGCSQWCGQSD